MLISINSKGNSHPGGLASCLPADNMVLANLFKLSILCTLSASWKRNPLNQTRNPWNPILATKAYLLFKRKASSWGLQVVVVPSSSQHLWTLLFNIWQSNAFLVKCRSHFFLAMAPVLPVLQTNHAMAQSPASVQYSWYNHFIIVKSPLLVFLDSCLCCL